MDTDSAPDDQSSFSDCGNDAQGSRSSSCRTSPTSSPRRRAPETTSMSRPPPRMLLLSESPAADKGFRQRPAKRYKRPTAAVASAAVVAAKVGNTAASAAVVGSSLKQTAASPMKRRILRKDRRQTLEMLTSDDDVNEYVAARPSTYIEPASRRNLHEVTPNRKSSFETLYNPEFNHLLDDPELFGSDVSSSGGSLEAERSQTTSVVANSSDTWHLVSGPKVSSPYLDVTSASARPRRAQVGQLPSAKALTSSSDAADNFDQREDPKRTKIDLSVTQQDTSGEMWTEFGGHERIKVSSDKGDDTVQAARSPRSSSQPLNVTIKVSKPSEPNSSSSGVNSSAIGVDLKIELGKHCTTATADRLSTQLHQGPRQDKLPVKRLLLPDKPPSPRKLTSPETDELRAKLATNGSSSVVAGSPLGTSATVEKPRERRVLPAVPDSADLEVSDLLRESLAPAAADRPKSAVEILVAKGRSSSILQMQGDARSQQGQHQRPPSSMVSQQLRSLFHNPSPQIMLHRAATRTPQAAPAKPESVEFLHQQQANRYLPLRGSHHRGEDTWRSGTAADSTASNNWRLDGPTQGSLQLAQATGAEQPPELPLRRNQSLLPSQRSQQQPQLPPPRSQSAVPPPPPVPPRQAKTTIARQPSPSTFFTNRRGNASIDHMHKGFLLMPASQSDKHTVSVEKSPEPGGSEYSLAADAAADVTATAGQRLAVSPQVPTRIQTNPRAGARAQDSITRQADSPRFAQRDPMDQALDLSSLAPKEEDRTLAVTSTATVGEGRLVTESQRDELKHRPVSRRDQDRREQPAAAAKVSETPGYHVRLHTSGLRSQQVGQTFGNHQPRLESHSQTMSGPVQSGQAQQSPVATGTARNRLFGDRPLSGSHHQNGSGQLEAKVTGPDKRLGDHSRSGSGQLDAQATGPDRLLGDYSRSSPRQARNGEAPQPSPMVAAAVRDRQLVDQAPSWSHSPTSTGQPPVVNVTVRDRLFGDQARLGIHHKATAGQAPVATSHNHRLQLGHRENSSEGSRLRQTTSALQPEAPAAVAQPPVADRTPASRRPAPVTVALPNGKAVRMPPNAVRVLPNADSSELQLAMRSLGGRSARSPRPAPDDAVTDLERLCRSMRLDDAGLLDGADRHDTSARLRTRLDALAASPVAGPVQAPAAADAASKRPMKRPETAGPESYVHTMYSSRQVPQPPPQRLRYGGTQPQQSQRRGAATPMLQPGERETGPEVIL